MDQSSDIKELLLNLVPTALSVISKVALIAVLYGLEYLVEKNSPCPCDPEWNGPHSDLAFSVPTVVLFLISVMVVPDSRRMFKCGMCSRCPECGTCNGCPECGTCSRRPGCYQLLQSYNPSCGCWNIHSQVCFVLNTLMQISIPSVIWVVLLLLDGDYYACYFAPSVNRTHGHQKCEEFCSLESSSSLREHCFWSRRIGSIILMVSVSLLVLLKFVPRWTYCNCTEEGYYEFKYKRALEKKKWNKMKKKLGNMVAETANAEAEMLISNLRHCISVHGEQYRNQGEQIHNQDE